MKNEKYRITFTSGETEEVIIVGENRAIILAQAEQIKKGNTYKVESTEKLS